MKRLVWLAASLTISVFASASAWAGESPAYSRDGYWSCKSHVVDNTFYFSSHFEMPPGPEDAQGGFAQMLYDRYGFKGMAACTVAGPTLAAAEAGDKSQIDHWRTNGVKIIDTAWTYSPATSLRYFCFGGTRVVTPTERTNVFYTSPIQQVTAAQIGQLQQAWSDYLQTLHSYVEMKNCQIAPADPANLQGMQDSLDAQWKGLNGKVTHTDWSFASASQ